MAYGTVLTDVVQSSVTGSPPQFNDGTGTQTGTLCRAWVNFNGLSGASPVIRASFNVSSVTRNGTGDYTITFTNALSDINYSLEASCSYRSGGNYNSLHIFTNGGGTIVAPTTSAARLQLSTITLGSGDSEYVCASVFR